MENLPSKFVLVEFFTPFSVTPTPIKGRLSLEDFTIPVIVRCWAKTAIELKNRKNRKTELHFL
jgi:hypothetical protein